MWVALPTIILMMTVLMNEEEEEQKMILINGLKNQWIFMRMEQKIPVVKKIICEVLGQHY